MDLKDSRIVLGVSGGIAAFRALDLCSLLQKQGATIRVVMTAHAQKFIAPLSFETLTQHPVYTDLFDRAHAFEMEHISWSKWGQLLLIAPATANILAKMAMGIADDALSTLYLSFSGPVVVAPAMNTQMLLHPATQHNLEVLRKRGVAIIEPAEGRLACGDVGPGKLPSPEEIVAFLTNYEPQHDPRNIARTQDSAAGSHSQQTLEHLVAQTSFQPSDTSLAGKTVVITSGPTHEYLDPVRFITNPSSGKMGAALAREAARRGAKVHLVSGPVSPSFLPHECATIHKVTTAEQMLHAVQRLAAEADIFVFAAAVSDYRVAERTPQKIKRSGNSLVLHLIENPDIAQAIGCHKKPWQITVGFAAETEEMEANALAKMAKKHLDAIVANDVADPRIGFDRDENEVTIYLRTGERRFVSRRPKSEIAKEIFDAILDLVAVTPPRTTQADG
ncbi:MAG: bifunctional phosphopantothenoylcysteine decarboxylase/phosphopantothenate synthase [Candidatus Sumerlaea chitinivorans]|uniref:Coenzyme A biosynthesis bifunctional protein CoaBC n=1 Tax=Sumerlaea chitinivorans TaxID=2250252 RepID=A0A2Z4Y289_SUMC1|nr:Phosphopantothenoylcysteine decarboxylase [Candidatus Sumerlaea chitinivorans]MCX7963342.1 bifunctional phosphopantothenoylcysteine decarboxylase/phosphopantothenate synthase [Candidatus Sumerlaea chitinivorans]